jgi:aryl carrier-like protein
MHERLGTISVCLQWCEFNQYWNWADHKWEPFERILCPNTLKSCKIHCKNLNCTPKCTPKYTISMLCTVQDHPATKTDRLHWPVSTIGNAIAENRTINQWNSLISTDHSPLVIHKKVVVLKLMQWTWSTKKTLCCALPATKTADFTGLKTDAVEESCTINRWNSLLRSTDHSPLVIHFCRLEINVDEMNTVN